MAIQIYKSLEDKSRRFECVTINTEKEFDDLALSWKESEPGDIFEKGNIKKFIFRGLNEAKYKLYNSAQRLWNSEEIDKQDKTYQEFIQTGIDNAKSYQGYLLHKFYDAFGHQISDISILSFLQHYGAPTTLIDFTYQFDIAAFFAIGEPFANSSNELENYCSIYGIDLRSTTGQFSSIIEHIKSNITQFENRLIESGNNINSLLSDLHELEQLKYKDFHEQKLFYLPGYEPNGVKFKSKDISNFKLTYNQHTLNIINQSGLLVFNSDENHPLEDFFSGGNSFQSTFILPKMKCWNIHKKLREYILRYLNDKSIDRDFIYPQEEKIAEQAFRIFKKVK